MTNPIVAFDDCDDSRSRFRPRQEPVYGRALKEAYDRNFRVVVAKTRRERDESYRLRYQVYCLENAFEPAEENPAGRETDAFDAQSVHSLLRHRTSMVAVGTVRLILPDGMAGALPLPIETVCAPSVLERHADRIPRSSTAEISRFAVAKKYRRRVLADPVFDAQSLGSRDIGPRHAVPNICLGLMRAIVIMTKETGMSHLYAVMEPTLLRLLRNLGIYFETLGPMVDYHGRRQPCYCDLDHLLATAHSRRPDVWAVLTDSGRIWPLNRRRQAPSDNLFQRPEGAHWFGGPRAYPEKPNSRLLNSIRGIS